MPKLGIIRCMTFLAIDVGNTRLKWALYDAPRSGAAPIAQGAYRTSNNTASPGKRRNSACLMAEPGEASLIAAKPASRTENLTGPFEGLIRPGRL